MSLEWVFPYFLGIIVGFVLHALIAQRDDAAREEEGK